MIVTGNFKKIKKVGNNYYGISDNAEYNTDNVRLSISVDDMETWNNVDVEKIEGYEYILDIVGDEFKQVAVSNDAFYYSTDGINFTRSDSIVYGIYSNTSMADVLSITGEGYWFFNGTGMAKSSDGIIWESIYPYQDMGHVLYDGTHYCNFSDGRVSKSLNFIEWEDFVETELTQPQWVNNRFIQYSYSTSEIITSTDGVNIDTRANTGWGYTTITWDGTQYLVIRDNYYKNMYSSPDAITWDSVSSGNNLPANWSSTQNLKFFNGIYFTTSPSGSTYRVFSKTSSTNWNQVTLPFNPTTIQCNNDIIVIGGADGNIAYSVDGINFTITTIAVDSSYSWIHNIIWSGTKFYGNFGNYAIIESSDGIEWEQLITPFQGSMVLANGNSLIANFNTFMSISTNAGITWDVGEKDILGSETFDNIFYNNTSNILYGHKRESFSILVSYDSANTWSSTEIVPDNSQFSNIVVSYIQDDELFIISKYNYDYNRLVLCTTPDFITFSSDIETNINTNGYYKIVKSGSNYVALNNTNSNESLISSNDLSFWIPRTIYSEDNSITWNEYNSDEVAINKFYNNNFYYTNSTFAGTTSNNLDEFLTTSDFINWESVDSYDSEISRVTDNLINNSEQYIADMRAYVLIEGNYQYAYAYAKSTNLSEWNMFTDWSVEGIYENQIMAFNDSKLCINTGSGNIKMISISNGALLDTYSFGDSFIVQNVTVSDTVWFVVLYNTNTALTEIWKSVDGIDWEISFTTSIRTNYTIGKLGSKRIIIPSYSHPSYYSSIDDINWVEEDPTIMSNTYENDTVAISGNVMVIGATGDDKEIYLSEDVGNTWVKKELPSLIRTYIQDFKILATNSGFILIFSDGNYDDSSVEMFITTDFDTYTPINYNPPGSPPSYAMLINGYANNLPTPSDIIVRETDDRIWLVIHGGEGGGEG